MKQLSTNFPAVFSRSRPVAVRVLIGSAGLIVIALLGIFVVRLPLLVNPRNEKVNILVIMVDDLDKTSFDQLLSAKLLPNIEQHIVNKGVHFEDSIVTNSACCPSRASFLTGQYAHNHGVNSIGGTYGGMLGFHPGGDMTRPTLATWLNDTGNETSKGSYFTGLIGKYMNHYVANDNGIYPVPAGWDVWRALNATGTHQLEPGKYEIVNNEGFAEAPLVYQTRYISDLASQFLANEEDPSPISWRQSNKDAFFLYLTPTAPHVVSLPEDQTHYASCSETHPQWQERVVPDSEATNGFEPGDYRLPEAPSCDQHYPDGCLRLDSPDGVQPLVGFDIPGVVRLGSEEAFLATYDQGEFGQPDESLRPAWIDFHWDPLTCGNNLDYLRRQHLDRLESMLSVDVMVGGVITELESQGILDNTLIIFTSDNGFMLGEHRLGNKQVAYEESIRVPLVIRPPHSEITDGRVSNDLVANIDLAPTILDYAGQPWEEFNVDGRSLRPILEKTAVSRWRDRLLVEHWHPDGQEDILTHPDRWWRVPTHMALRMAASSATWPNITLVQYQDQIWGHNDPQWIDYYGKPGYTADFLYDLGVDPNQVGNLIDASEYVEIVPALKQSIRNLSTCKSDTCRQADSN